MYFNKQLTSIIFIMDTYVNIQGDRSKKVGVIDSEYIVHKGIQSLGGSGHVTTRTTIKVLLCLLPLLYFMYFLGDLICFYHFIDCSVVLQFDTTKKASRPWPEKRSISFFLICSYSSRG